jgi:hypothetical protein
MGTKENMQLHIATAALQCSPLYGGQSIRQMHATYLGLHLECNQRVAKPNINIYCSSADSTTTDL